MIEDSDDNIYMRKKSNTLNIHLIQEKEGILKKKLKIEAWAQMLMK